MHLGSFSRRASMKKNDNYDHPEKRETDNICSIAPKTKITQDVCGPITKSTKAPRKKKSRR